MGVSSLKSSAAKGEHLQPLETPPEEISAHNLLGRLPSEFSGKLLAGKRTLKLREGETLFERGDVGDGCYWLRQGVVTVCASSAGGEQRILAILGSGAIVGELAMIDGLPRSATVQAVRDCSLSFISRAAFTALLRQHPELHTEIMATLAARLRQSDEDMIVLRDVRHHLVQKSQAVPISGQPKFVGVRNTALMLVRDHDARRVRSQGGTDLVGLVVADANDPSVLVEIEVPDPAADMATRPRVPSYTRQSGDWPDGLPTPYSGQHFRPGSWRQDAAEAPPASSGCD
jgi:CRP-like cAMP-binding protein